MKRALSSNYVLELMELYWVHSFKVISGLLLAYGNYSVHLYNFLVYTNAVNINMHNGFILLEELI